jgi:hypothetical protein
LLVPCGTTEPACTLLVFIDDAIGRLMTLHFTASESTFSYFEATRAYIEFARCRSDLLLSMPAEPLRAKSSF